MTELAVGSQWLTLVGVIITAVVSLINSRKSTVIHQLVNSQFSQAKREIADLHVSNAVLLRRIAKLSGSTEDEVRAEVAAEQSRRAVPLPKEPL